MNLKESHTQEKQNKKNTTKLTTSYNNNLKIQLFI